MGNKKQMNKDDKAVEEDELFNALNAACIKGGADKRALPHYVKAILRQARKEGRGEGIKVIENLFPYSFTDDMEDHAEIHRGFPEDKYLRRTSEEEDRIIDMIINELKK